MNSPIMINVNPSNPGQFFACCGLLELANRLWNGAEGWFEQSEFCIQRKKNPSYDDSRELLSGISSTKISSTMSEEQITRLKKLKNLNKKLRTPEIDQETEWLNSLWEGEQLRFASPFDISFDWWSDSRSGGSRFKTWAGKQFVIDIVRAVQALLRTDSWKNLPSTRWLTEPASDGSLPLYFDSDNGCQSSSIDVGFSLDSLELRSRTRPLIELAAFAGLQRFRPQEDKSNGSFTYVAWTNPLPPMLASVACCGALHQPRATTFEFRLLYRSKYLKSFLPAAPKETNQ